MKHFKLYCLAIISIMATSMTLAQVRVGVNTTAPERPLHIYGSGAQYMRLHSIADGANTVGLELVRGHELSAARDWKVENAAGIFKIATSNDNFQTSEQVLRINEEGHVGIGTNDPMTPLHINNGEDVSLTGDGYLMLGEKNGPNLVMDQNEIQARNNGSSSSLFIQTAAGNTWFGDGDIYLGGGNGKTILGLAPINARFNLDGPTYQINLINDVNGYNDWYIGASSDSWQTGDDQLVFSPSSSQLSSTLRLHSIADNDGIEAPVMITSPSTQTLLLDGNEIDTRSNPLYINHNSNHNTLLNTNGGQVGIGTNSPDAKLHIKTTEYGLGLKRDLQTWWISPSSNGDLQFYKNTSLLAYVDLSGGGAWVAVSDQRLKEQAYPLTPVLEKIGELGIYSYEMIPALGSFHDIGVIAQELEPLFPEAVSNTNDQYGVCYDQLTVIAIKGIQEQQSQLEQLHSRVDALLAKIK